MRERVNTYLGNVDDLAQDCDSLFDVGLHHNLGCDPITRLVEALDDLGDIGRKLLGIGLVPHLSSELRGQDQAEARVLVDGQLLGNLVGWEDQEAACTARDTVHKRSESVRENRATRAMSEHVLHARLLSGYETREQRISETNAVRVS